MAQKNMLTHSYFRETTLLLGLIVLVLLFNYPTLQFRLLYNEQAPLYLANQHIGSLLDLLNVYLHPQLLYEHGILFFRPSGHFLMYQLFAPLLGWHNIRGFLIVSLIFLALSGYMMIKIYNLIFPGFKAGGYIAFSIYLMHPALILPRMMIEHFDFAHIFFSLLSLYYFIIFCQQNKLSTTVIEDIQLSHYRPLLLSLIFYGIAITFKEVALVLGAVLIGYLLITLYRKPPLYKFLLTIMRCRQVNILLLLLAVTSLLFTAYISMAWATLITLQNDLSLSAVAHTLVHYLQYFTGTWQKTPQFHPDFVDWWFADGILFPIITRIILYLSCIFLIISTFLVYIKKRGAVFIKSLSFLYFTFLVFLVTPAIYSIRVKAGHPWHLNLSLVFFSLLLGFSFELVCQLFRKKYHYFLGLLVAIFVGSTNIIVIYAHIYDKTDNASFAMALNRNAILAPPDIKNKLTPNSVIIIEDSQPLGYYLMGDSFIYSNFPDFELNHVPFLKPNSIYNSLLFRWAYLMPALKEQVYPFQIDKMLSVPDFVLYWWLKHYDNIFCLGYDDQAKWHDRTAGFKKNLLAQQKIRQLKVNHYHTMNMTMIQGGLLYSKTIPIPKPFLCQNECDQNILCRGFVYLAPMKNNHSVANCYYLSALYTDKQQFCGSCTTYVKLNSVELSS